MKAGIVGLPNVGKSTLFNCLSDTKAQSANFPFCTIEPNHSVINVPDKRLNILKKLVNPEKVIPATVEIVDIAGLVKGASKGEGLGNKFLANIRETDAIIHVLRCFDNDNITHVDGTIDPVRDKEIIDIELQLKDLESILNRLEKVNRSAKSGDKESIAENKNKSIDRKLIVINGQEITRSMPPGHINAIFLKDANKLLHPKDSLKGIVAANKQDAFVFWNHPAWPAQRSDGIAKLDEFHKYLIEKDLLHGIEVVNELYYSEEALRIALENDLTIMGTSDIHELIDWQYRVHSGGHRPVTLVFAFEKTKESLKKALMAGRTVVWFNQKLIGKIENLIPLINSSLVIESASYIKNTSIAHVIIKNISDAPYTLRNQSNYVLHNTTDLISIPPHSYSILDVRTVDKKKKFELQFEVLNALSAPSSHPIVRIQVRPRI